MSTDNNNDIRLPDKKLEKKLADQNTEVMKDAVTSVAVNAVVTGGDTQTIGMGTGLASAGTGMATNTLSTAINDNKYTKAVLDKLPPAARKAVQFLMASGATLAGAMAQLGISTAMQKAMPTKPVVNKATTPPTNTEKNNDGAQEKTVEGTENEAKQSDQEDRARHVKAHIYIGKHAILDDFSCSINENQGESTTLTIHAPISRIVNMDTGVIANSDVVNSFKGQPIIVFMHDENDPEKDEAKKYQHKFKFIITSIDFQTPHGKGYISHVAITASDAMHLLNSGPQLTTFHGKPLDDIAKTLLEPTATKTGMKLYVESSFTKPIDTTTQFNESILHFLQRIAQQYGQYFYCIENAIVFGKPHDKQSKFPKNDTSYQYAKSILKYGKDKDYTDIKISTRMVPVNTVMADYSTTSSTQTKVDAPVHHSDVDSLAVPAFNASNGLYPEAKVFGVSGHASSIDELQHMHAVQTHRSVADMVTISLTTNCFYLGLYSLATIEYRTDADTKPQTIKGRVVQIIHHIDGKNNYINHISFIPEKVIVPPTIPVRLPATYAIKAKVTSNKDTKELGRVQVEYLGSKTYASPDHGWIPVAAANAGPNGSGMSWTPQTKDIVLVSFSNGDPSRPYVSCSYHDGRHIKGKEAADPNKFVLQSRTKSTLVLDDTQNNGSVHLTDACSHIHMDGEKKMTIEAPEIIRITCGKVGIEINGETGTVNIFGAKINIGNPDGNQADDVTIKGTNFYVEAETYNSKAEKATYHAKNAHHKGGNVFIA